MLFMVASTLQMLIPIIATRTNWLTFGDQTNYTLIYLKPHNQQVQFLIAVLFVLIGAIKITDICYYDLQKCYKLVKRLPKGLPGRKYVLNRIRARLRGLDANTYRYFRPFKAALPV